MEHDNISVKGKRRRVEAFEILGMKDPLKNRDKIPQALYEQYRHAGEQITIPEDVTLPSEVLDGSVGQSRIVAVLSFALADSMGLPEREKSDILSAGFLADIGREVISADLRNRRGGLTPNELELVRQHPDESCRLMRKMGYDNPAILNLVQHTHEHFGGGGYPGKFRGAEIPMGSRIIAVADAYNALTSRRSYRESWERHAALGEIRGEVEKGMFDAAVVEALVRLLA
jgi:HD-GYP domain-containing protein (c-di-GMP phosphodiesterase class II)